MDAEDPVTRRLLLLPVVCLVPYCYRARSCQTRETLAGSSPSLLVSGRVTTERPASTSLATPGTYPESGPALHLQATLGP